MFDFFSIIENVRYCLVEISNQHEFFMLPYQKKTFEAILEALSAFSWNELEDTSKELLPISVAPRSLVLWTWVETASLTIVKLTSGWYLFSCFAASGPKWILCASNNMYNASTANNYCSLFNSS